MAVASPIGIAIKDEPAAMSSVPLMSGRMPNACGISAGDQRVPVRNSTGETSPKNPSDWLRSTTTIPTVVSTDMTPQPIRSAPMMRS